MGIICIICMNCQIWIPYGHFSWNRYPIWKNQKIQNFEKSKRGTKNTQKWLFFKNDTKFEFPSRVFIEIIFSVFSIFSNFRTLIENDIFEGFFRIFEHFKNFENIENFENIIFGGNPTREIHIENEISPLVNYVRCYLRPVVRAPYLS